MKEKALEENLEFYHKQYLDGIKERKRLEKQTETVYIETCLEVLGLELNKVYFWEDGYIYLEKAEINSSSQIEFQVSLLQGLQKGGSRNVVTVSSTFQKTRVLANVFENKKPVECKHIVHSGPFWTMKLLHHPSLNFLSTFFSAEKHANRAGNFPVQCSEIEVSDDWSTIKFKNGKQISFFYTDIPESIEPEFTFLKIKEVLDKHFKHQLVADVGLSPISLKAAEENQKHRYSKKPKTRSWEKDEKVLKNIKEEDIWDV